MVSVKKKPAGKGHPQTEVEGIEVCRSGHATQSEIVKSHHDVLKPLDIAPTDFDRCCGLRRGQFG